MPSTVYYYAWLLVLLRFALPLPGLVPATAEKADATPAPAAHAVYSEMDDSEMDVQEEPQQVSVSAQSEVAKSAPAPAGSTATQISLDATETQEMTAPETAQKASLSIDWRSPKLWFSIWALGAVVSMGITVFSYLRFNAGLKRNLMEPDSFTKAVYDSIPGRKPALYFSDSARTPMMLGVFNPKIVLPYRKYNEELLLNILRHELTHYRRFDTLYKWVTVAILSVHWFNPLAWFIRRELNRACEMSCDEMLLRSMNRDEKQSYGNSLLLMAASNTLPSAVVATSFATEKRNLKERLVQIMNYKKSGTRMLAAVLAIALLTGCGVAAGPVSDKSSSDRSSKAQADSIKEEGSTGKVKTVDEFLAAIAPDAVIELDEGIFDLSTASDYAKDSGSDYYYWDYAYGEGTDSAELVIHDVKGLTIIGSGMDKTSVVSVPRYANVIRFSGCRNLTVSNLTAGHTEEPGYCTGGVLLMENCSDTDIIFCGLYGCGTVGVIANSCERLNITNSDIYECSIGAVELNHSEDVLVSSCDIHDHGTRRTDEPACDLFSADYSTGFTVYNCKIHDNNAEGLLYTSFSKNVFFLSNEVSKNSFYVSAFYFEQVGATVDGCSFEDNFIGGWYRNDARIPATDINGNELASAQFTEMQLRDIKPGSVVPKTPTQPVLVADDVAPGTEINVTTIDEFLSAIGPDRTIVLDGTNFNLAEAKNYGGVGTQYYSWEEQPDGPQLVIHDANNLTIKAKDPDPSATTLEALPRYASVLVFSNCTNVNVTGFTAGHTKEKGYCAGGVLYFSECDKITVEKMRLYGCGTMGIDTFMCSDINVIGTEIYECTSGGCDFYETRGINLTDCDIHDVPSPALRFTNCKNITWNDQELNGDDLKYDVNADSTLTAWKET
jgi:beta-lactamase regulating signal transducer with metallopeptidase domain